MVIMKHTPNAYRKAKSLAKRGMAAYRVLRVAYVRDLPGLGVLAREDRLAEVLRARYDAYQRRAWVRTIESDGVELGAAWSPRALANHVARQQRR